MSDIIIIYSFITGTHNATEMPKLEHIVCPTLTVKNEKSKFKIDLANSAEVLYIELAQFMFNIRF